MVKTPSGRKFGERRRVSFTEGKEKKKWTLRGTCNDTSRKSIVPTVDAFDVRKRTDRRGVKEDGL
jgi:hypothetical protein